MLRGHVEGPQEGYCFKVKDCITGCESGDDGGWGDGGQDGWW